MITDIVSKKRIHHTYPIWGKEFAIVSMFSDNIQYEFMEPKVLELEESRNN